MKRILLKSLGVVLISIPFVLLLLFSISIGGVIATLYILGFVGIVFGFIVAGAYLIETN